MKRSTRREIAKDTLRILKQGSYRTSEGNTVSISKIQKKAEQATRVYRPEELEDLLQREWPRQEAPTEYAVRNATTLDVGRSLLNAGRENIFCLNFASAKNPGGGFLNGSQAQEESLARASGLYNCQLRGKRYYDANRNAQTCLYTDYMIYSPQVPVFKDEEGRLLESYVPLTFLTAPAVNAAVVKRQEPGRIKRIVPAMKKRIEMVLSVAAENGHRNLVLGAWGCGVFGNEPEQVADLFAEALLRGKFRDRFAEVVFAIYDKNQEYLDPFLERFP